ncbi:hypothetical protein CMV_014406 [Castanea mollissima]|uniref:Uncharacterized protein n=1 Tax=Castanea mollissima TaxID=60419 RepID=A0A8J4QYA4_9ROSI|nr:hypothetical protein CMV_014406 [Castanea mollissima]
MAFLFNKFQEAVKTLAKSPTFARDPRQLQFEADINRLFLYTSYNRLGRDAEEADAEEIIEMASKASLADQQKLVQENIHAQIKSFSMSMDEILLPDSKRIGEAHELPPQPTAAPRRSGLGFAVGRHDQPTDHPGTSTNEIETDSLVHIGKRNLQLGSKVWEMGWSPSRVGEGRGVEGKISWGYSKRQESAFASERHHYLPKR